MDPTLPIPSDAAAVPRTLIAISSGDPLGIGPEITVKSLARADVRAAARFCVFGVEPLLAAAARRAGIRPFWVSVPHDTPAARRPTADVIVLDYPEFDRFDEAALAAPTDSRAGGAASFRFIEDAIAAARLPRGHPGHADAIVTAPISKTSWNLAGHTAFPGHTELLAARFNAARTAMLFVGPTLRVILVTIHVPLARVPGLISAERVLDAIELGQQACVALKIARPRIAVCGLNPHAGEHGLLGEEDDRHIAPAIAAARARDIDARGPFPADTVFLAAAKGAYDLVVAMYHDQGLIPVKLLDREQAVNVTVGLDTADGPAIRTSPAHGTAFDIAGRNLASDASMAAAIRLAARMAREPGPAL